MELVQPIRDKRKIARMKAILKLQNIRNYLLFTLGINSGLRISDLLKLKVSDVADESGNVKDRITLREKKTGKSKDFPVGATAKKAILEYLDDAKPKLDDYLFPSRKGGGPLSRFQAYRILSDAAKIAGIKEKIGTHSLRKTFGYHAYKQGMDLSVVQKLLNHSSPGQTLAYIGITQDDLDKVYLTLNL